MTSSRAAADAARSRNDIVFLEALADDWPRLLYEKVGFDVISTRQLLLRRPHSLTRLRLRTPRLELRLATVAELRVLAQVARAGIHPPDEMPFKVPWTDRANEPGFEDDFVRFHRAAIDEWRADRWALNLVAFVDGSPVGSQGLEAERFDETLTVSTGSWLGRPWQGLGLGTEMRAAVLEFAFGTLGARLARSGALAGNEQSLAVSRKLGYAEVGPVERVAPRHAGFTSRPRAGRGRVPVARAGRGRGRRTAPRPLRGGCGHSTGWALNRPVNGRDGLRRPGARQTRSLPGETVIHSCYHPVFPG